MEKTQKAIKKSSSPTRAEKPLTLKNMTQEALDCIKNDNIHFMRDLADAMGTDYKQLQRWGLTNNPIILEGIRQARARTKRKLRDKWKDLDAPALQIALYRLISEDDEYARLVQNKLELTGKDGKPIQINLTNYRNYEWEELERAAAEEGYADPMSKQDDGKETLEAKEN